MSTFMDGNKKTWSLQLYVPLIEEVREYLKLDLVDREGKAYDRLCEDPVLLCNTLWIICKEQAEKEGVDKLAFLKLICSDVIVDANRAMLEAIADFSPSHHGKFLRAVAAKTNSVQNAAMAKALEKINDPSLEAKL